MFAVAWRINIVFASIATRVKNTYKIPLDAISSLKEAPLTENKYSQLAHYFCVSMWSEGGSVGELANQ